MGKKAIRSIINNLGNTVHYNTDIIRNHKKIKTKKESQSQQNKIKLAKALATTESEV